MNSLPRIRSGLLRHTLEEQVVVYDSRDDKVHLVDPTTARVMELLDQGGWTHEGITSELGRIDDSVPASSLLTLALDELRKADLLDEPPTAQLPEVTRRELLRKVGMVGAAALLVPAIATLTASPAYAASCVGIGHLCGDNGQCCSGNCSGSTFRCVAAP